MAERNKDYAKEKPKFEGPSRFPQSIEIENELLGNLIKDPQELFKLIPSITEDYFFHPRNKKIYSSMVELAKKGTVDALNISDYMSIKYPEETGVLEYLLELIKGTLYSTKNDEFVEILYRDMILRKINECGKTIIEASEHMDDHNKCLDFAESSILSLSKKVNEKNTMQSLVAASADYLGKLSQIAANRDVFKGLRTHYPILDYCTDGLKKGNLIILAARPSVGKSSFALNIVTNIMERKEKKVIAIFSLEMPAEQIVQRVMATMTNVTMKGVFSGEINEAGLEEIFVNHAVIGESDVYIDDNSLQTPNNIWSKCRRLKMEKGQLDLIIVDYLQLLNFNDPTSSKRVQELSETAEVTKNSRMLKMIAMDMLCPVVALSQLSRSIEGRDGNDKASKGVAKIPKLSDLRQSGSIEQDADVVMFLAREREDTEDKGKGYIILAIEKNRNGALWKIMYKWDGDHVRFTEDPDKKPPMSE